MWSMYAGNLVTAATTFAVAVSKLADQAESIARSLRELVDLAKEESKS